MKTWLNTELSKTEWDRARIYFKESGFKYEASGCGSLVHIEVLADNREAEAINNFLDTL